MKAACITLLLALGQTGCTAIGWAVDETLDQLEKRPVAPARAEHAIKHGEDVELDLIAGGEPVEGRFGGVSYDRRSILLVDDDLHERAQVPIEDVDLIHASPHESGIDPYAGLAIGFVLDVVAVTATVLVIGQMSSDLSSLDIAWR